MENLFYLLESEMAWIIYKNSNYFTELNLENIISSGGDDFTIALFLGFIQ